MSQQLWTISKFLVVCTNLAVGVLLVCQSPMASAEVAETNENSAVAESVKKLKAKSFIEKVGDRIGSIDIEFKVNLLDVDLLDGLKTALDYKYDFEPSYTGEYHLRTDRAILGTGINIGELLHRTNKYVGLQINHAMDIAYVRGFQSKSQALTAAPFGYTEFPRTVRGVVSRFPFSAENVTDHMNVGDLFSYTTHLDIIVSASSLPISLTKFLSASTQYLISGQFQVYMVKSANNRLLLKMVALRKKGLSGAVTVGYASDHKIFALKMIGSRISAITNITEMFQVGFAKTTSNLTMVDYFLDMNDERVREAYDGIAASLVGFKSAEITDPRLSSRELTDKLLSDITPFESIFEADRLKPTVARAVDRSFIGENDVESAPYNSFKFAPIIAEFSKETSYFENMLTSARPTGGGVDYYRLHTFQRTQSISWWFSYYKGISVSSASLLFDSSKPEGDQPMKIGALRDISFEWNYRDKSLTVGELKMIKSAVKQAVPASIHNTIKWGAFDYDVEFSNARFSYRMILHPAALEGIRSLQSGEFEQLLNEYIVSIPEPTANPQQNWGESDSQRVPFRQTVVEKYKTEIRNIAHYLSRTVDPKLTNKERSDAFSELRFNDLFIEIAPGFLVSLLPQGKLEDLVNFEITLVADDVPPMPPFRFGKVIDRKIYDAAKQIHSILTANEFDIITGMFKSAAEKK